MLKNPKSAADEIWEEIRNLPIEMFALPNQRVEDHLVRMQVTPNELYLKPKSSSALPAFEAMLKGQVVLIQQATGNICAPKYLMEETDLYIIVRRNTSVAKKPGVLDLNAHPVPELRDGAVVMSGRKD
jgi:hypothetical protein